METHRGILPNKRLRFWWAVVGLIALVVPYVTNMGLLAKTVYAAEKTLYKSDRLTVTAGMAMVGNGRVGVMSLGS